MVFYTDKQAELWVNNVSEKTSNGEDAMYKLLLLCKNMKCNYMIWTGDFLSKTDICLGDRSVKVFRCLMMLKGA